MDTLLARGRVAGERNRNTQKRKTQAHVRRQVNAGNGVVRQPERLQHAGPGAHHVGDHRVPIEVDRTAQRGIERVGVIVGQLLAGVARLKPDPLGHKRPQTAESAPDPAARCEARWCIGPDAAGTVVPCRACGEVLLLGAVVVGPLGLAGGGKSALVTSANRTPSTTGLQARRLDMIYSSESLRPEGPDDCPAQPNGLGTGG